MMETKAFVHDKGDDGMSSDIKNGMFGTHYSQEDLIIRPRVHTLLDEAVKHSAVTIIAGAGCGKTQAVFDYISSYQIPYLWVSLSGLDNYLVHFWSSFTTPIEAGDPKMGAKLKEIGPPDTINKTTQCLRALAERLRDVPRFLFVFDNCHLITHPIVQDFIHNLAHAELENACVILMSRYPLNIDKEPLPNNNFLARINGDQLRFTPEESELFFQRQGICFSPDVMQRVQKETDGWPLLLYLISLQQKVHPEQTPLLDIDYHMVDLLIREEIFDIYPGNIQKALIKLSLLETYPLELFCQFAEIKEDEIFDILFHATLIRYDERPELLYFHHLFSRFLKEQQHVLTEEEVKEVYLAAGDWFFRQGRMLGALEYYDKCSNYEGIWNVMRSYEDQRCPLDLAERFLRLIEQFPQEFKDENKLTYITYANLWSNCMNPERNWQELEKLKVYFESLPQTEEILQLLGEVYLQMGNYCLEYHKSYDFVTYYRLASEHMPKGSQNMNANFLSVENGYAIHLFSEQEGELDRMVQALFEAVPYSVKAMNGCTAGMDYLAAAEAAYFQAVPEKAVEYAKEAINKAAPFTQFDIFTSAYFVQCRAAIARGNYVQATENLEQIKEYLDGIERAKYFGLNDIATGWFYCKIGHSERVAPWILDDLSNPKLQAPLNGGRELVVKALYLLDHKKYYELLAQLAQNEQLYQQRKNFFGTYQTRILKAVALYRIGDLETAVEELQGCYKMANGNQLDMCFIEMGNDMRVLIDAVRNYEGKHNIPAEWLNRIYTKSSTYAKHLSRVIAEYEKEHRLKNRGPVQLSSRETEILQSMAQGLTREEIADSYDISINTVKSVLRNIYNKLGAINRADAIRIAADMQLIQ